MLASSLRHGFRCWTPAVARVPTRALLLLAAFAILPSPATGQGTGAIRGEVIDSDTQRPLAGVQVLVQGAGLGTLTREAGEYLIRSVPAGTHTVVVQRIGYTTRTQQVEVRSGETAVANFEVRQEALGLDEIIVTGQAGQARRREVGNSISQIDVGSVAEPAVNTESLLQGRAPGLMISQAGAGAGSGSFIRLRGNVSVTQSNFPLVYVDGVRMRGDPYPANIDENGRGNSAGAAASAMNLINPDDIERVEIIKGAAATTLYGTEAAAGVIQIFTKSGAGSGDPVWTAQSTYTMDRMLPYGTDDYPYLRMEPWLRNAHGQEYDVSVRGGVEDINYFLSTSLKNDDGVMPLDHEDAYAIRGNVGFQGIDNLTIQWNTGYSRRDLQNTPTTNSAASLPLNVYRGDRNYVGSDDPELLRPLLEYELTSRINHLNTGVTLRYQPTSNWSHKLTAGYDFSFVEHRNYKPFNFLTDPQGILQNQRWSNEIFTFDYATNYNIDLREGVTATLSAGAQVVDDEENSTTAWSQGFPGPGRPTVTSGSIQIASESRIRVMNAGFFGQARFGFGDRLFVTTGARVDGNTAFGEALGLELYPKVSASYILSDEGFWNEAWGNIKLRGAWGQSGRAPGAFDAVKTWAPSRLGDESAFLPQNLGNPNLGPERTSEIELGVDGAWFANRLSAQFTYYYQRTKDALFPVRLPPSEGSWNAQLRNVGELENKGIEVGVNATVLQRPELSWDLGVMVSTNNSEILDLGGAPSFQMSEGPAYVVVGQPAPVLFGNVVTNPNELADPIYADHFYGPNVPTRILSGTSTLTYRGILLSLRGEYQGGHYAHSRLEEGNVQRNVAWPPCMPILEKGIENMTALERSECVPELVQRDYMFRPLDFFKMREITLQVPVRFGVLEAWSPTVTLSARNAIKWTEMDILDPEMAGQRGSADDVRTLRDNVPAPATFSATVRVNF